MFYCQLRKNTPVVLTSANIGIGSFMPPWHLFSDLFSLVRKLLKCINALIDIFNTWYGELVLISLITQNKSCWHVLYKAGVQSE